MIFFGAAITVAAAVALGTPLVRRLGCVLSRGEYLFLSFVIGAACLSMVVFACAVLRIATQYTFLILAGAPIIAAALAHRNRSGPERIRHARLSRLATLLTTGVYGLFGLMYLVRALAPEFSPDGSTYHLGLVQRYLREQGFVPITTNIYASLSQGAEMLFMIAASLGGNSAATLVHLAFLCFLAVGLTALGARLQAPLAGACASLLVFCSPVVGITATSAYNDLALACTAFGAFYLVSLWKEAPTLYRAFAVGVVAGFCYGIKYTGAVAVIYALGAAAWRLRRSPKLLAKHALTLLAGATLMMAPWMLKNALWLENPVSPFFNSVFRNPYVHIWFERDYISLMRQFGGVTNTWDIPLEVTVRGFRLSGLLGPVFLLAPLGLLGVANRRSRPLVWAGLLFLAPYPANISTRFLLPAVPFLSLALCLVLGRWPSVVGTLAVAHAVLSWPPVVERYASEHAWRLRGEWPLRAALRLESEDQYLGRTQSRYLVAKALDRLIPRDARVLAFEQVPEAYTSRSIIVSYQGAFNQLLTDFVDVGHLPAYRSALRLCYAFPSQPLQHLRLYQNTGRSPDQWSISEVQLFRNGQVLPVPPGDWRVTSFPNPWDSRLAVDGSLVTRWRTWEPLRRGMSYDLVLPHAEILDSLCTVSTMDQHSSRVSLYGGSGGKPLRLLAQEPGMQTVLSVPELRSEASAQLRRRGITHLLVFDSDRQATDFRDNAALWQITLLARLPGARLYQIN